MTRDNVDDDGARVATAPVCSKSMALHDGLKRQMQLRGEVLVLGERGARMLSIYPW